MTRYGERGGARGSKAVETFVCLQQFGEFDKFKIEFNRKRLWKEVDFFEIKVIGQGATENSSNLGKGLTIDEI